MEGVKRIRMEPASKGDMEAGKDNCLEKARRQEPGGQEGQQEKKSKPKTS